MTPDHDPVFKQEEVLYSIVKVYYNMVKIYDSAYKVAFPYMESMTCSLARTTVFSGSNHKIVRHHVHNMSYTVLLFLKIGTVRSGCVWNAAYIRVPSSPAHSIDLWK